MALFCTLISRLVGCCVSIKPHDCGNEQGDLHHLCDHPMGHPPMHQAETLLRRCLLEMVPISRTKDVATTMLCTTMAGLWGLIIHLIAVIVREFLAYLDIPDRHNPDGVAELFCVAVGLT